MHHTTTENSAAPLLHIWSFWTKYSLSFLIWQPSWTVSAKPLRLSVHTSFRSQVFGAFKKVFPAEIWIYLSCLVSINKRLTDPWSVCLKGSKTRLRFFSDSSSCFVNDHKWTRTCAFTCLIRSFFTVFNKELQEWYGFSPSSTLGFKIYFFITLDFFFSVTKYKLVHTQNPKIAFIQKLSGLLFWLWALWPCN